MNENNLELIEKKNTILPGFCSLESFELIQRIAGLFSKSTLVPQQYQGNISNCVVAINMANRMNADVLMTMQNLYIVHGTPAWSAKFMIATFNTCGRFSAIRYKWIADPSDGDAWGCQAWAVEKATGETLKGSIVTIGIAKKEGWYEKNGSKWRTMPQQMLMYRAAAWFIRAYAPEISMGLYTEDEVIDVTPEPLGAARREIRVNANTEVFEAATEKRTEKPIADRKIQKNVNEMPENVPIEPAADKPEVQDMPEF